RLWTQARDSRSSASGNEPGAVCTRSDPTDSSSLVTPTQRRPPGLSYAGKDRGRPDADPWTRKRPPEGATLIAHRTAQVDGLSVFYREAGAPATPKLLLLGGFPASSHQFRNLIPALANRFHSSRPTTRASATPTCLTTSSTPSTGSRRSSRACSSRPASTRLGSTTRTTAARSATASSAGTPTGWSGRGSQNPTPTNGASPPPPPPTPPPPRPPPPPHPPPPPPPPPRPPPPPPPATPPNPPPPPPAAPPPPATGATPPPPQTSPDPPRRSATGPSPSPGTAPA